LSGQPTPSYLAIAAAIVIAGVLISASLYVAVGEAAKMTTATATRTSVSTTTITDTCSTASSLSPSLIFPFEVVVSYSGPWNATLTAYSGPGAVFSQCYVGSGTGFMILNDWNPNGTALLEVTAQKLDGSSGNLTVTVNAETNSTIAPYGSVSVSAGLQPSVTVPSASTGPTSIFPAEWMAVCGESLTGNTSTTNLLPLQVQIGSTVYPINLTSIYDDIVGSSAFQSASAGHAWVTAEWSYGEIGNPVSSYQIQGLFIIVVHGAPAGYVYAYYTIPGGSVSASLQSGITVACTTTSTSACTSSSQIATTSTNDSVVFNLGTLPSNFTVGDYRFVMVYNGTGYGTSSNGSATTNPGYSLVFNIIQGSETQMVTFGSAPPAPYPPGVPSPSTATAFNGNVHMQWVATCSAIFFEISAQPAS
jgi:hypothetical protein